MSVRDARRARPACLPALVLEPHPPERAVSAGALARTRASLAQKISRRCQLTPSPSPSSSYQVLLSYKPLLQGLFLKFSDSASPTDYVSIGESTGGQNRRNSSGSGSGTIERRVSMKDAAKRIILVRRTSQTSSDKKKSSTTNGLEPATNAAFKRVQAIARLQEQARLHGAHKPLNLSRCMSGMQFLKAAKEIGLINAGFGYAKALEVLVQVTRKVHLHEVHVSKHHHHHGHHSGGGRPENIRMGRGSPDHDDEEEDSSEDSSSQNGKDEEDNSSLSESDSCSSFDSDSDNDDWDDDDRPLSELYVWGDEELTEVRANYFASMHNLLFTQFVEAMLRLILKRYKPVVPKPVLNAWRASTEDYQEVSAHETTATSSSFANSACAGSQQVRRRVVRYGGRLLPRRERHLVVRRPELAYPAG